jgi:APA family basic amino acid/polyamine antiporter
MRPKLGLASASGLVVASMIGTGVYTTSGLMLAEGRTPLGVLAVWAVAGLLSLAGALSYAELASVFPESGGEYALLSRVLHPAIGFVAGIASIVLGFAAPIAACGIAFARYAGAALGYPHDAVTHAEQPVALAIVVLVSLAHAREHESTQRAQDLLTFGKLALAILFVAAGVFSSALAPSRLADPPITLGEIAQPSFAYGVVLVSFAYTGWNAAVYVGGEIDDVHRTLPRALGLGTLAVTLLYLALNALFLAAAPSSELAVVEIAHVAATHLFGELAARVLSSIIAFGLLSTIGAFVLTGTRVYGAMGRDHPVLARLAPHRVALVVQALLAAVMIATSSFDTLLASVGVTLSLSSALTVAGVLVVRRRGLPPHAYRTPGYPITPIAFVVLSIATIAASIAYEPLAAVWGTLSIAVGLGLYVAARRAPPKAPESPPPG